MNARGVGTGLTAGPLIYFDIVELIILYYRYTIAHSLYYDILTHCA